MVIAHREIEYLNCSDPVSFAVYICQDYLFDLWKNNRTDNYYLIAIGISISGEFAKQSWKVESSDLWHICWKHQHAGGQGVNFTLKTIINKV